MPTTPTDPQARHRILAVLLDAPAQGHTTYDLMRLAQVSSAALFPVISTLRRGKVLDAEFVPQGHGLHRRAYRLRPAAQDRAKTLLEYPSLPPQPRPST